MTCIPTCHQCKTAGTCNGSGRRAIVSRPPKPEPRRTPPAVRAAIEAELRPYIPLVCGHLTTADEQRFYEVWRPKPQTFWCSIHGRWQKKIPEKPPVKLPDVPMF